MKVLKNNYNYNENIFKSEESYPKNILCSDCGSELEYEKSDLRIGAFGCCLLDCPLCGCEIVCDDIEMILTKDNVEFPTHFWHTSVENGAVDNCDNYNVKTSIERGIDYLRKNKDEYYWMSECGSLHVSIYKWDGDRQYEVLVTNDYYSTYIPFENVDY